MLELSNRNVAYGYDNDYRLTSEAITADPAGNNGTVSYTQYDAVGNRQAMTSTLSAVPSGSFSYDNNDRLAIDTYDANGNTISSAGTSNTYDFENRMLSHGAVTLIYDADGNRVSETAGGTTTKYLVDSLNPTGLPQVMDEKVSGTVTRTYAYGLQRISEEQKIGSTWTPSFYGYDGHDNVRFLANKSAAVTDSYDFDAFGMPIKTSGTTANMFLYSGERYDSSVGLYDLRARYFNQATGRFWARDPAEGVPCTPITYNSYIYAGDDPVDRIDPTGLYTVDTALSYRLPTLTIPGQIVLGLAISCAYARTASTFAGMFENALMGLPPGDLQEANPCWVKPRNQPCRCKPCIPPAGTYAYRMDQGPPLGHTHHPAFCCHVNLRQMNQNPRTCECFWNRIRDAVWIIPFGAIPDTDQPAEGGGCE